ncbi:MAG: peptidoglycan bridge formation glycyltransferase FemA/FemB family protein [Luteibaculum sp.]
MVDLQINIEKYSNQINSFLDSFQSPAVLAYHYSFYQEILEKIGIGDVANLVVRDKTEKIIGFLPAFSKNGEFGKFLCAMPFFGPNCGVIADPEHQSQVLKLVLDFIDQLGKNQEIFGATIYEGFLPVESEKQKKLLLSWSTNTQPKFGTYIDLRNYKMPSSVSYDVRKAEKNEILISSEINDSICSDFYKIYLDNCQKFGIPIKPKTVVDKLLEMARKSERVKYYGAFKSGHLISGLIVLYGPQTVSYYLPCSDLKYRNLQANSLLIAHAMEEAQQNGMKIWNWEASPDKDSGVYKFKSKWNSLEYDYSVFNKIYSEQVVAQLTQNKLENSYQYFFVYPFNLITES